MAIFISKEQFFYKKIIAMDICSQHFFEDLLLSRHCSEMNSLSNSVSLVTFTNPILQIRKLRFR